MNSVCLIGRTTSEIELKSTISGKYVCHFTLAVNGYKEHTDFIRCTAWGPVAERMVKYVGKGRQIGVTGRITTSSYEDKNGSRRDKVEITVDQFYFADSKKSEAQTPAPAPAPQQPPAAPGNIGDFAVIDESEDLPF